MIEVIFIQSIASQSVSYSRGGRYALPADLAKYYISVGICKPADTREKPETAIKDNQATETRTVNPPKRNNRRK